MEEKQNIWKQEGIVNGKGDRDREGRMNVSGQGRKGWEDIGKTSGAESRRTQTENEEEMVEETFCGGKKNLGKQCQVARTK